MIGNQISAGIFSLKKKWFQSASILSTNIQEVAKGENGERELICVALVRKGEGS